MNLRTVRIRNYRAIEELDLSFNDDLGNRRPMTVIAGPNGCGKTSILFAIVQALRGVLGYRTADVSPPSRDDIRSPRSPSGTWITERPEIEVELTLQIPSDEQAATRELLAILRRKDPRLKDPPPLPEGVLTIEWYYPPRFAKDGTPLPWWSASVSPSVPNIRSWLKARSWAIRARRRGETDVSLALLARIGGIVLFPQDRNLRDRITGTALTLATDDDSTDEDELRPPSRRSAVGKPERPVTEILHYVSDYVKSRVPPPADEENWEKRIQQAFARICTPKEYAGFMYRGPDDPDGAPVMNDRGRLYPLSHAASGEQVILEYITRLTYPSPSQQSIILIDEPEIHLHPAWVRRLYLGLPKIGTGNQFIVTTHSAELRQRAAADNALVDLGPLENSK